MAEDNYVPMFNIAEVEANRFKSMTRILSPSNTTIQKLEKDINNISYEMQKLNKEFDSMNRYIKFRLSNNICEIIKNDLNISNKINNYIFYFLICIFLFLCSIICIVIISCINESPL